MTNRTISIVFVVLAWVSLVMSVYLMVPILIIYSLAAVFLAHYIYHGQDKGGGSGRMRH